MLRPVRAALPAALLLCVLSPLSASAGSGDEVMRAVETAMQSPGEEVRVRMELKGADGQVETRTLTMWQRKLEGKPGKTLIRFDSPGSIAGTALLTIQRPGKNQDNWLWVPALRQVRRIAPTDRTESFVQSDFTIEDLSVVVDPERRNYEVKGEAPCGQGRTCELVEDRPADDKAARESGYGYVVLHVDKELRVVHKVEFYDKSEQLLKVLKADGLEQVGDQWRFSSATIADVQKGTSTVMAVTERVDGRVDDSIFSPAALEAF